MEAVETKQQTVAEVAAKQPKDTLVFNPGELFPLKGVWFRVERVEKEGMFLAPIGFTGKARK